MKNATVILYIAHGFNMFSALQVLLPGTAARPMCAVHRSQKYSIIKNHVVVRQRRLTNAVVTLVRKRQEQNYWLLLARRRVPRRHKDPLLYCLESLACFRNKDRG
jgi:hypothetical protein